MIHRPVQRIIKLSRQQLRQIGRDEILEHVNLNAKAETRKERRQLARQLHKQAWDKRDRKLIHKVLRGQPISS